VSRISGPSLLSPKKPSIGSRILLSIVGAKEGGVRATSMICSFDSSMIQTTSSSLFFVGENVLFSRAWKRNMDCWGNPAIR